MNFIAIKNFFKDLIVVEVEEEVSEDTGKKVREPADRPKGKAGPESNDTKNKVTQLDLSRNEKSSSENKKARENTSASRDKNRSQGSFFKKERQKPADNNTTGRRKNSPHSHKETTLMNADNMNAKVHLFEPRVFSETQDIADELKNERATLVNLSKVDSGPKKRIVDFLSGTVYALDGDIQKVGNDIFLCTPKSVVVEGEISSDKEYPEEM
ncbi:cell division protein SepF [Salinicoccus sp. Marseille-QA3877]